MASLHQPVLVDEVLTWLTPREGVNSIIVDGTVGGGGHAVALSPAGCGRAGNRAGPRLGDAGPGGSGRFGGGIAITGDSGPCGLSRYAACAR